MTTWVEALAMWRSAGGKGKIPSKGSDDYAKVIALMSKYPKDKVASASPKKSGIARKGTKAGAKFMKEMEEQHFQKVDLKVGPRGAVKKMPKKMVAKKDFAEKVAQHGLKKLVPKEKAPRKVRADAGKKRGPSKKGSKAGNAFMAEMEEKFF
jgi:hypothetical protein